MKFVRFGTVALAVAALAAAAVALALPAGAAEPDESRSLTVTGIGAVKAVPDVSEWSFGVQTDAGTARDALRRNASEVSKVIAALKSAGIATADLRTQQVSLSPRLSDDGSKVVGYTASNSVTAVVRSIARTGSVIDAAAEAGANQIFGPTLTVSGEDDLLAQALDRAYDRALAKAQRLAAKVGVTLGRPLSIVEGESAGGPVPLAAASKDATAETPIEPGQTTIQASLTVVFAIT
jgi:uncharacterized protein YggE